MVLENATWRLPKMDQVGKLHSSSHTLNKSSRQQETIKKETLLQGQDKGWAKAKLGGLVNKDSNFLLDSCFPALFNQVSIKPLMSVERQRGSMESNESLLGALGKVIFERVGTWEVQSHDPVENCNKFCHCSAFPQPLGFYSIALYSSQCHQMISLVLC